MLLTKDNSIIGFVGTGVMRKSMAGHLIKAGYQVLVFNGAKRKAEALIYMGATWQDTVAE